MVRRRPTAPTAESLVLRLRFWADATCASTACALPQAELQQPLGTSAKACGCVACLLGAPRIKLLTALPACPTLQRSQVKAFHQAAAAVAITHLRWHTARRRHAWHAHAQSMSYAATLSADGSERACCAGVCAGIPTPRPCPELATDATPGLRLSVTPQRLDSAPSSARPRASPSSSAAALHSGTVWVSWPGEGLLGRVELRVGKASIPAAAWAAAWTVARFSSPVVASTPYRASGALEPGANRTRWLRGAGAGRGDRDGRGIASACMHMLI